MAGALIGAPACHSRVDKTELEKLMAACDFCQLLACFRK